jgi:UDP-GlcNAc:undecaprenyl-phosphate GlcNAc-1-phosphate transferase
VTFLVPFTISFFITGLMIRWAPALRLMDIPNARKVHAQPIPKGGGLSIFIGWVSAALILGLDSQELWIWGGIGLIVVGLGLVDDIRPLPWQLRLGVQAFAAIGGVWLLEHIRPTRSLTPPDYIVWPAAVIWIVGLTNAFNMLDNMDALSGGVAWITAALFAEGTIVVEIVYNFAHPLATIHHPPPTAHLILMGALTGFLWFNRPPARIFMGDAGSTFLGFFFGTSSLLFAGFFDRVAPGAHYSEISNAASIFVNMFDPGLWSLVFCFLAIPWYDLVSVVSIRLWQGRSPFHADKQHLSHRLVALGLSPPRAVTTICYLTAVIGSAGGLIFQLADHGSHLALVFVVSCWIALAGFEFMTWGKRQIADKSS